MLLTPLSAPVIKLHTWQSLQHCDVSALQVTYSIHTVRVELYESAGDYVRLVLEITLSIWVCIQILSEFWNILQAKRQQVQYSPPCHGSAAGAAASSSHVSRVLHDHLQFSADCDNCCLLTHHLQRQELKYIITYLHLEDVTA